MNPFSYGTIVKGDTFYDRKEECSRIIDTLTGGNNVVLYAPRRFGKTSLVCKAIEQLESMGYVCIYFDFMPVYSPESFVRLYTKALAAKQPNLKTFAQTFASIIKNVRPTLSFAQDGSPEFSIDFANSTVDETMISELLDMPEKLAGSKKRVMVFFDEFQEVEKLKNIHFEGLLRSKVQQQSKTNYLFFGSKTHLLKEMFNAPVQWRGVSPVYCNRLLADSSFPLLRCSLSGLCCRKFISPLQYRLPRSVNAHQEIPTFSHVKPIGHIATRFFGSEIHGKSAVRIQHHV